MQFEAQQEQEELALTKFELLEAVQARSELNDVQQDLPGAGADIEFYEAKVQRLYELLNAKSSNKGGRGANLWALSTCAC